MLEIGRCSFCGDGHVYRQKKILLFDNPDTPQGLTERLLRLHLYLHLSHLQT